MTGLDFADEPKREVKVNKNGIVTFRVDVKNCSQIARNDAAPGSVDGNLNVSPAPPG